jgi:purine-cytosine permease-like protein
VLLYVLVPWTAINLVDYYLVAHGEYHVESFYPGEIRAAEGEGDWPGIN